MASDTSNSPFIKHLASSDKETRDAALTSLRTYLSALRTIPSLDLLKLWKGLFYCLWMQDKPPLQQRLARDLASLVSILQPPVVLPFLDAFWKTMAREWNSIAALRMDKYLYLVRQYVNASFRYLEREKWEEGVVERGMQVVENTPLNVGDQKIPNGMRYHVLDVWVDELEKVVGEGKDVGVVPVERVLGPVGRMGKESRVKSLRKAAKEVLEDERVRRWRGEVVEKSGSEDEDMDGGEEKEEEWGGIED